MKLALIFLGIALGLLYGHLYSGFIFSSKICLFAGITLIMPTLFNVKLTDIKLLYTYRVVMMKGFLINYILLPLIALAIGILTNNFGIAAGLFLLSVLSGGGMVMHWIKTANADASLGFLLLFVNLVFVSLSLLMLHNFGIYTSDYFGESYLDGPNMSSFAKAVIILLIIVPFLVSRVIIFIKPLRDFIEKQKGYISDISIFIIIFYLFALQKSQSLFEIYEWEPELIFISFAAVLFFYAVVYLLSIKLYDMESPQERAAFWHTLTRYITLALVISTFSIGTFGTSMLLPIMFAYMVQIPFSAKVSEYQQKKSFTQKKDI